MVTLIMSIISESPFHGPEFLGVLVDVFLAFVIVYLIVEGKSNGRKRKIHF